MIPLTETSSDSTVKVVQLPTGRQQMNRLFQLGLVRDEDIIVVKNNGHGPLLIMVKDTKVILGRGIAGRVMVELESGTDVEHQQV